MFRSILAHLVLLLFCGPAFGQTLDLSYLSEKLDYFPEAKRFEATYQDLKLQGIEVGPKDGVPVLFVGGFTSNLPVYKKLVLELASRGFRVFNYNPPGQGAGSLTSLGEDPAWQSFGGLVEAMELMHRTVYEMTGQKLLLSGHSLGGMQARVLSLGLEGLREDKVKVNQQKRLEFKNSTKAIVPILSPSLSEISRRYQDSAFAKAIEKTFEFALRKALPWTMETYSKVNNKIPEFATGYLSLIEDILFSPVDSLNRFWLQLFTGRDIDFTEMRKLRMLGMSETIHTEIVNSLHGWNDRGGSITENGFNLGEAWIEKQNSETESVPTLLVIAEKDSLAPKDELLREAAATNTQFQILRGGHIDPLFDNIQLPNLVDDIVDMANQEDCETLLTAS